MSKVKNLVFDIEDDIRLGVLSFKQIADKYSVSIDVVNMIWNDMCEQEFQDE